MHFFMSSNISNLNTVAIEKNDFQFADCKSHAQCALYYHHEENIFHCKHAEPDISVLAAV